MSTQEKKFDHHYTESNDNIHVEVTKFPHCQIKFDIKVTPKATEAAYLKALKNVNKEVNIPGFRKGRAPEKMIVERFEEAIQKEFIDIVLQTGFNDAIDLTHLHPLKEGKIKRPHIHECSREKGASFTIEFEARTTIPTVKLEEIEIQRIPRESITDQERQNAIQNLQLQFATYTSVEDRGAQEEDFIDVSVTLLGDHPREVIQNQRTQINSTGLPSWLRSKVIGLKAGESAEGMTEQDPALGIEDPHFTSVPFRITIHSISEGHLPAIDDELAKKVKLETVEDLHQKINERLTQEIEEEAFRKEIHEIEKKLIEHYPIDLPQSYIDSNKEARLNDYLKRLAEEGREYTEEEYQQIKQSVEETTILSLQLFFLLKKIAADYNISVDNQDISEELTRQISMMSSGRNSIDFNDKDNLRSQLKDLALDRKIKQLLVNTVVFKD
ncbi:MAG: trigger factor [Parachlamydiaceae bacterium]